MIGVLLSQEEYNEYMSLKKKNTAMYKRRYGCYKRCPACNYVVDHAVPPQRYCDRCGQKLGG